MKLLHSTAFMTSLGLTLIVGIGFLYYFHHLNLLTVVNESEFPLESVTIRATDQIVWQGDIEATDDYLTF